MSSNEINIQPQVKKGGGLLGKILGGIGGLIAGAITGGLAAPAAATGLATAGAALGGAATGAGLGGTAGGLIGEGIKKTEVYEGQPAGAMLELSMKDPEVQYGALTSALDAGKRIGAHPSYMELLERARERNRRMIGV